MLQNQYGTHTVISPETQNSLDGLFYLMSGSHVFTWEGASEGGTPRNRGRRECQQPRTFWGPFPEADRPTWLRSVIKTSGEQEHQ